MKKILIVDDQVEVRELVQVTLEIGDYQILSAENGQQAVDIARVEHPDIILLDIMMPGSDVDGLEACRLLKADPATADITTDARVGVLRFVYETDPERDDVARMAAISESQKLSLPTYQLLTGPGKRVNDTLDNYGFIRKHDPETGEIDHNNLFIVIDRSGRVAYTLSLIHISEPTSPY